jgi:hypothetical protein
MMQIDEDVDDEDEGEGMLEEEAEVPKAKEAAEPCNCRKMKCDACGRCQASHCTCKLFECEHGARF